MTPQELRARTDRFSVDIINFCRNLPADPFTRRIALQLHDAGTSVASNYHSACRAQSRAQFVAKLSIALEKADECVGRRPSSSRSYRRRERRPPCAARDKSSYGESPIDDQKSPQSISHDCKSSITKQSPVVHSSFGNSRNAELTTLSLAGNFPRLPWISFTHVTRGINRHHAITIAAHAHGSQQRQNPSAGRGRRN